MLRRADHARRVAWTTAELSGGHPLLRHLAKRYAERRDRNQIQLDQRELTVSKIAPRAESRRKISSSQSVQLRRTEPRPNRPRQCLDRPAHPELSLSVELPFVRRQRGEAVHVVPLPVPAALKAFVLRQPLNRGLQVFRETRERPSLDRRHRRDDAQRTIRLASHPDL